MSVTAIDDPELLFCNRLPKPEQWCRAVLRFSGALNHAVSQAEVKTLLGGAEVYKHDWGPNMANTTWSVHGEDQQVLADPCVTVLQHHGA